MRSCTVLLALAGWAAVLTPTTAAGQTRTATLKIVATVVSDCVVTAQTLDFGNYDPVGTNQTQPLDASTEVSVVCTRGTIAAVDLGDGQHASGGQTRRMAGPGAGLLAYELYVDPGRRVRWGAQSAGVQLPASTSTAPRLVTVYGRVAARQDVVAGRYSDEVMVTVRF